MTRVFYFDEHGTFFVKEVPGSPQELKKQIIAKTWATDVRLPWDDSPISVQVFGNTLIVTPPGCSGEEPEMSIPKFTSREREVLEAMVEGLGQKEIGQRLTISSRTVKDYISGIKKKLNAETPINAVARAVALGLCKPKLN